MTNYENVVEALREADLELEEAMENLTPASAARGNPRFDAAARARELDDEVNHIAKLSSMLQRHAEVSERLQELHGEDTDGTTQADQVEEASTTEDLTATQTSRQLINMFGLMPPETVLLPSIDEQSEEGFGAEQVGHDQWSLDRTPPA